MAAYFNEANGNDIRLNVIGSNGAKILGNVNQYSISEDKQFGMDE